MIMRVVFPERSFDILLFNASINAAPTRHIHKSFVAFFFNQQAFKLNQEKSIKI